jgi:ABC-type transport system involved in multi-copper enzyme maturation permease subunit
VTNIAATLAVARLTGWRLVHSRAPLIGIVIAALPIAFAAALRGRAAYALRSFEVEQLLLVVLPSIVVAASISTDLEDRSITYLWSRPLPRWAILAGKLVVLAPYVVALVALGWIAATGVGAGKLASPATIVGLACGALATTLIAAGLAVVAPRYGMVLAIIYMLVDAVVGQIPAGIQMLSVTHDVSDLAGVTHGSPMIAAASLAIISGLWLIYGLRKIRSLEA